MISIEELVPQHFDLVAGWLSKVEINRWLTAPWRNRVVTATFIAIVVRDRKNRLFLVRCDSQPCGLTALADIDTADGTAMVWYVLGEQTLSGRGITAEAVRQLARLCFDQMRLASIYAWVMEDNAGSTRVLQKAGFREAGRIRCAASSGGRQVDRIYFDLIAADMDSAVRTS
jgi:RimJ/RimL family protein N-acetyltransferase